ncbi:sensor histidine kinase [Lentzea sp. NBRC 105346]|uniref:sensor histidine kinase n=1 Tax=Lentzea sp. NBRC 105346 TaxID=3032205 RepID=UPI0024A1964B|nr:sensor histidine kinase KdpD [Lentzea sp. NBRC 105346]GLZ31824.1 sensor histidine kinase [Lentzea sp. NBRC 105346]
MPSTPPVDARRGELRIYLGAAPGVGKTFAMLGEAHRRRERGTDVVVGLVETHGREKTANLLEGLEILPRKEIHHRGLEFTELDIDGLVARAPEVAIVDELAHTNVPGSRNEKRWQDVEELLEAGIDVLSTVNVQHLESLNDVVERITGVTQRETVPDEVVRRAEQVELVDITPEALRRRLAHGNVYAAHKIDAALGNYFRVGNLTALRELALLWVADQVDVALQRYRHEQRITDTWETRERVVAAITGGPESETLIRRARRIALRAGAELLVVHVMRGDGLAGPSPEAVGRFRKIAEDLGATFHSVVGDDVPTALLEFARGVNATQLVLGTSRRSRLARAVDEGIGAAVIHDSGPIDVHMVTHDAARRGLRWKIGRNALSRSRQLAGWAAAVLLPSLTAALGLFWRDDVDYSTDLVGFLLATCVVALMGGLGPALFSAFLGAGLLNFFFTPPYYSLAVASPENVITLVAMVIVATIVALVVDRAARLGEQGARARTEAALLASYARTVLTSPFPLARLLEKVRENFGLESVALLERRAGGWERVACVGPRPCDEPDEADADVAVTSDIHLALRGRTLPASDQRVLEAAAGQALMALRQQRMAAETLDAQRKVETTELRTALLSAVGHDLRTPLTSIKAAIGSLRDPSLPLSTSDVSELMATVEESADRLNGLVDNLLDSSRLATGSVTPLLRPVSYYEAVAKALAGIEDRHAVTVDVDEHLPPVCADLGLLERAVANVVDNALRHGKGEVAVRASTHGSHAELRIVDHGPGLPKKTGDRIFTPFQRLGDRDATSGVGLGLSVAKGFTEAMGGEISAEDTPGGGLTIVISLPVHSAEETA